MHEEAADSYQKVLHLERRVLETRQLLEAEEQLLYVDAIAELQRIYLQLQTVRAQQRKQHTPWVRHPLASLFTPGVTPAYMQRQKLACSRCTCTRQRNLV